MSLVQLSSSHLRQLAVASRLNISPYVDNFARFVLGSVHVTTRSLSVEKSIVMCSLDLNNSVSFNLLWLTHSQFQYRARAKLFSMHRFGNDGHKIHFYGDNNALVNNIDPRSCCTSAAAQ